MGIKKKIADETKVMEGEKGKDKTYYSFHNYPSEEEAQKGFDLAVIKLLEVNKWSDLSIATASFQLYKQSGIEKVNTPLEVNDFVKINLPIPSPENWVKVIDCKKNTAFAEFTVRPCAAPNADSDETDHFFTSAATSTFKVERKETTLYGYEIGKNEIINNNEEAGGWGLLNTLIAEGGWAGFQKFQWKKLTDYLVHLQ